MSVPATPTEPRRDRRPAAIIAVLSCLLGLGAGALAVSAVAGASPDDAAAATSGPAGLISPTELISYGG